MYICGSRIYSACRGLKRASKPLELELLMAVSHLEGTGNQTQVLYNSSECSEVLSLLHPHTDALLKTQKTRIKGNQFLKTKYYSKLLHLLYMFNLLALGKLKLQVLVCFH